MFCFKSLGSIFRKLIYIKNYILILNYMERKDYQSTYVTVIIFQISFVCAFPPEISSTFGKSFPLFCVNLKLMAHILFAII